MKIEVECLNLNCPTVERLGRKGPAISHRQLLECDRTTTMTIDGKSLYLALDEDGNEVECPWCFGRIEVKRLSRPEAQFALGKVDYTPGARRLLGFNIEDDPIGWMEYAARLVARHVSGDHGHIDQIDQSLNKEALEVLDGQSFGRIFSGYDVNGQQLWIITERSRNVTTLLVPEEYQTR